MDLISPKLNRQIILNDLNTFQMHSILAELHIMEEIDSTNRFLKDLASSQEVIVCCAETQTAGKGRFGRQWISLPGENIYLSLRRSFPRESPYLSSLSLVTGLAVRAALNTCLPINLKGQIQLKWPNDLIWDEQKLGGILVELIRKTDHCLSVVIGIGINVNARFQAEWLAPEGMREKAWTSMYECSGKIHNRNHLISQLIYHLDNYIHRFQNLGFETFMDEWNLADYLKGKAVKATTSNRHIYGIAGGVNLQGQLLIEDAEGASHTLLSGETSLHLSHLIRE